MTDITLRSDIVVKLIRASAQDDFVVQAAQVSVKGENKPETDSPKLINYLMEGRHGSPFEHNSFTFFVEAPIFVFREWHRHRIGISINEMSGRYTQLIPHFYTPGIHRPLVNAGSSARPEFKGEDLTTRTQRDLVHASDFSVAHNTWAEYQSRLQAGIANEIARTVLPVSVYSQMYWTANARSIMNFLSLRVDSEGATFRTRPQREIEMGAEQVEAAFAEHMPHTHAAFVRHGRVAP